MEGDTIIGAEFEHKAPVRSMLHGTDEERELMPCETNRLFKIRTADSMGRRSSASVLINRMYKKRGYLTNGLPEQQQPTRLTLVASDHDTTIGTITVGFDSENGLLVDDLFSEETDALRAQGRRICEFTKLAMDSVVRSKRVLASLFHVAYIYAHRVMGFDDLLIEVNPRHVRYYQQMLGFVPLGAPRHNQRVNAPAVLMCLELTHARDQIGLFAGRADLELTERSLYPLFFSIPEEAAIVGRLSHINDSAPTALDALRHSNHHPASTLSH